MSDTTAAARMKAMRLRKKRGLVAVTIPSKNLSIDIRECDLPKLLALEVDDCAPTALEVPWVE
jgi:hypothetical protein